MEIPLVLTSPKPERLTYGFPAWYRAVMAAILAIVIAAVLLGDSAPGVLAWIILGILFLATVYEDRWTFDADARTVSHRAGLLIASRSRVIAFAEIAQFVIVPLVKGTVPGTEEEKAENKAAIEGKHPNEASLMWNRHKKPFLNLEIECVDGTRYLVDHVPARRSHVLHALGARIARHCEKPLAKA